MQGCKDENVTLELTVTIENLGKLKNTDVRIGNFTVFAGSNNIGNIQQG